MCPPRTASVVGKGLTLEHWPREAARVCEQARQLLGAYIDEFFRERSATLDIKTTDLSSSDLLVSVVNGRIARALAERICPRKWLPSKETDVDGGVHLADIFVGLARTGALRGAGKHKEFASLTWKEQM